MTHELPTPERIERAMRVVRGELVLLDTDTADLYGTTLASIRGAPRAYPERFPADFVYRLRPRELGLTGRRVVLAFTQQGVEMLVSVRRSHRSAMTTIEVLRAFERVRARGAVLTPGVLRVGEMQTANNSPTVRGC